MKFQVNCEGDDLMEIQVNHEAKEYIIRKSKDKAIIIEIQERPGRS